MFRLLTLTVLLCLAYHLPAQIPDSTARPVFESKPIDDEREEFFRPVSRQIVPIRQSKDDFERPFVIFTENGKKGLRDQKEAVVLPAEFKRITSVWRFAPNGLEHYLVEYESGKVNVVDTKGKYLLGSACDIILQSQDANLIAVDIAAKQSKLIGRDGLPLTSPSLETFRGILGQSPGEQPRHNVLRVGIDGYQGLVNGAGEFIFPIGHQDIILADSIIIVQPTMRGDSVLRILDYGLAELFTLPRQYRIDHAEAGNIRLSSGLSTYQTLNYRGDILAGPYKLTDANDDFQVYIDEPTKLSGFLNKAGKFISPPSFQSVELVRDTKVAIVKDSLGRTGIFQPATGKYASAPVYRQIESFAFSTDGWRTSQTLFVEYRSGKVQIYNVTGEQVLNQPAKTIRPFSKELGQIVFLGNEEGWKAFDLHKKSFVSTTVFASVEQLNDGYCRGWDSRGSSYFISRKGEVTTTKPPAAKNNLSAVFEPLLAHYNRERQRADFLAETDFTPATKTPLLVRDSEGLQDIMLSFNRGIADKEGQTVLPARFSSVKILPSSGGPTDTVYFLVHERKKGYNVVNSLLEPSFEYNQALIHTIAPGVLLVTSADYNISRTTSYQGRELRLSPDGFAKRNLVTKPKSYLPEGYAMLRIQGPLFGIVDREGKFTVPVAKHLLSAAAGGKVKAGWPGSSPVPDRLLDSMMTTIWTGQERIMEVFPNSFLLQGAGRLTLLSDSGDTLWQRSAGFVPAAKLSADVYMTDNTLSKRHFCFSLSDGRMGYVNDAGKETIAPVFSLRSIELTGALQARNERGQCALLGIDGKLIVDYAYQDFSAYGWDKSPRARNRSYFVVHKSGASIPHAPEGEPILEQAPNYLVTDYQNASYFGVAIGKDYFVYDLLSGRRLNEKPFVYVTNKVNNHHLQANLLTGRTSRIVLLAYDHQQQLYFVLDDGEIVTQEEIKGRD